MTTRFGRQNDRREIPSYRLAESAAYVGMPESTLRTWLKDGSLIVPADRDGVLLSFYNLVEAHILLSTRRKHKIPLDRVRTALQFVRDKYPSPHPLITEDFHHFGKSLFVEKLGDWINASGGGQLGFPEVLERYLARIERDEHHLPIKLYPFRRGDALHDRPSVVLDPNLSSGRPVINGTGVLASVLWDRKNAGESVESLAEDYGINALEVQKAIDYIAAA